MPAFFLFPRMIRKFPAPVLPERPSRTTDTTRASRLYRNQSVTYPGANRRGWSSTETLRMRNTCTGPGRRPSSLPRSPSPLWQRRADSTTRESLAASQWGPPPQGLTAARPGSPSLRFPPGPKATGGARAAMPSAFCRVRPRPPRAPSDRRAGEAGRRDKAAPARPEALSGPGSRTRRAARASGQRRSRPGKGAASPRSPRARRPPGARMAGAPTAPRTSPAAARRAHPGARRRRALLTRAAPTPPRGPGTAGSRLPAGAPRPAQQPPGPCSGAPGSGEGT